MTGRAVEYTRRLATSTTTPCAFPSAVQPTRSAIVLDAVKDTQDRQIVTIVQCAEALAHYVEELHARTAWTSSVDMLFSVAASSSLNPALASRNITTTASDSARYEQFTASTS